MNLTRCVRILPHHQDTGGFFVAVLRKTRPLPWMKQDKSSSQETTEEDSTSEEASAVEDTEANESGVSIAIGESNESVVSSAQDTSQESTETGTSEKSVDANGSQMGPPAKKARFSNFKEDPFVFFKEGEEVWPPIKEFYDVEESFPITQLLTRCHVGKKRNIYLTNKLIKGILEHNVDRLKVINSGVRVLARSDARDVECDFRLSQEGINVMYPYLRERKLTITREDVITLFSEEAPFTKNFSENIRDLLEKTPMGAVVLTYQPKTESGADADSPFILVAWRGKTSLRSYIAKNNREHILRLVGGPVEAYKKPSPFRTYSEDSSSSNPSERTAGKSEEGDGDGDVVLEDASCIEDDGAEAEDGENEEQDEDEVMDAVEDDGKQEKEEKI